MQFLLEDDEAERDPTDDELNAYLRDQGARYAAPARAAISHVFVSSDRHANPLAAAQGLAAEMAAGRPPVELGDPFLRGRESPLYSERTLAGIFGGELAAAVMALPVGEWSTPLRSSYGYHLVRVAERQPSRVPLLPEVRPQLLRDWRSEERKRANARALARLRAAYDVRVEKAGDV
jgi:hypothetical protein